jgi:hypothetical protein
MIYTIEDAIMITMISQIEACHVAMHVTVGVRNLLSHFSVDPSGAGFDLIWCCFQVAIVL